MASSTELKKAFAEIEVLRIQREEIEERLIQSQNNLAKELKKWDKERLQLLKLERSYENEKSKIQA